MERIIDKYLPDKWLVDVHKKLLNTQRIDRPRWK
jgi:hypothetical protein